MKSDAWDGNSDPCGAALTEGFLRQGAKVSFCQRSDATAFCDDMAKSTGNRPMFLRCDITDLSALQLMLDRAAAEHGPITVLVNIAANDKRRKTLETDEAFWDGRWPSTSRPISLQSRVSFPGCRWRVAGRS